MEEVLVCYLCGNQIEDDKFGDMYGEIVCFPCYDEQVSYLLQAYSTQ